MLAVILYAKSKKTAHPKHENVVVIYSSAFLELHNKTVLQHLPEQLKQVVKGCERMILACRLQLYEEFEVKVFSNQF